MCGIFGYISNKPVEQDYLQILAKQSEMRGKDSSGLFYLKGDEYHIARANIALTKLLRKTDVEGSKMIIGHSRLITNGLEDNQPVFRDDISVIHNGIIVNHDEVWEKLEKTRLQEIDTEIVAGIYAQEIENGTSIEEIYTKVLSNCRGVIACAVALPRLGKLCLFSNNGSLYLGEKDGSFYFASEKYPLTCLSCQAIQQVRKGVVLDIPPFNHKVSIHEHKGQSVNLIPTLGVKTGEEKLLKYHKVNIRRCSKCILPETMPYISFDDKGVCNYCNHYQIRNNPRPTSELFELVEPYRRHGQKEYDCIVPFSGGRDSCFGLHLIVNELKMKPITYTYDWGMVTDLGRRNISRMCAELGVENIIVADDINLKRKNIARNLNAWLKSPHLGMVSILTAGDKHFFRHIESIKQQTGINLNLWGVNPLEVTHFKAGFLGVPPDFEEKRVYSHGVLKQLRYQSLRIKAMLQSPGYFNSSLWDTLSGEYYRSFRTKSDYFHIFDFWRWDEETVDSTLEQYDWEKAPDTNTTWRIGDGTAAFYNYIYHNIAGFTEHDTFRSNQIREGQMTREKALELVEDENQPRYPNIKWYLDAVGLDFTNVIKVINSVKPLYPI